MPRHKDFSDNVFINCPFDDDYKRIFEAIIYAISDCGFIARCAMEENNAAQDRLNKILRIIDECKYGIHDLSRAGIDPATGLGRLNMAFELGLYKGAHHYSPHNHYNKEKRILILDTAQYRYQQFISDINGLDIRSHDNRYQLAISHTRDFLRDNSGRVTIPGGPYISARFETFLAALPDLCNQFHLDRNNHTFLDYSIMVSTWIKAN